MDRRSTISLDIFFTVLLVIVACIGIGVVSCNRVDKSSGSITKANYSDYLSISWQMGAPHREGSEADYKYNIYVKAKPYRQLHNLIISVEIESEYSDFGSCTLEIYYVNPQTPYIYSGTAHYEYPQGTDIVRSPAVKINVVAIAGTYSFINMEF